MKRFKGFLSLFVVTCIALVCLMSVSAAAETVSAGDFAVTFTSGAINYDSDNHILTISGGGEYEISGTPTSDTIKVTSSDAVTLTLAGVSISSGSAPPVELTGTGAVTVKLSSTNMLTSTGANYAGLRLSSADLIITSADGDGATTGSLDAKGGTYGAGIGSDDETEMGGSITINGGSINATGGTYGAGIGSGAKANMSGSITINGGSVSGTSSSVGAGIGGGDETEMSGSITINGGTVIGTSYNGAGIGSGWLSNLTGNIIINGGTVIGTSTDSGAGIGTGPGGDLDGDISITGGEVAGSSTNGAGIGASIDCTFSGTINISGGTVSGTATKDGSGIGVGKRSTLSGSINLSGGYMTFSSLNASAIGTAVDSSTTDTASINITGGYFGDGSYTADTVYSSTVPTGYAVHTNTDADTSGAYPCKVSYEAAMLNSDGVYEIANAGQLFWFAALVNGDTSQANITAAVADADAVLTADIDLNSEAWMPIGTSVNVPFKGTFDGQGYAVQNLYVSGYAYAGLFGYTSGSAVIKNVIVTGYVSGSSAVGGIVGCTSMYVTIENCANSATCNCSSRVGGVVGANNGTVKNCYNSGSIIGTNYAGSVVGQNSSTATVTNCYYLTGTATAAIGSDECSSTSVVAKDATAFASGEVTYLLNGGTTDGTQAWYQNINNGNTVDSYPVLDSTHGTVYYTSTACGGGYFTSSIYTNSSVIHVGGYYDSNGFCTYCGAYEPATLKGDGIYEIANAGQLFWFASLVNGDTSQEGITAAISNANAVLTSNIDLSVTTSTHTSTEWTPIGSESAPFSGTFDGDGYTVSGMSITKSADYVGLFGYVTGTVKNMTVDGSINVTSSSGIGVGGIVGCVYAGTLSHLTSTVDITGYDDTKGNYAGIVGSAMGDNNTAGSTVEECVYSGKLTASGNLDCIGGIVGYINAATINNCANFGTVDTTGGTSGGIYTGGILGYCNNTSAVIKNSYNYGTVEGAGSYIGAVVGRINTKIGGLSNCYYLSGTAGAGYGANAASIDPNSNITVKTAEEFASGEVAWLLQNANNNYVWGQHITGSTTDAYPIIKSNAGNEEDRVVCIEFYKLSNTIPYAYRYTNVDKTIAEYPGDGTYKFYRYSDLTGEIDTTTTTFTDNDCLYMYAQRDLIISKTNGDEAIEDADYTYENNILTVIYGGEYTIEMNAGITSTTDTIKVDTSDDVTITLSGVNITSEYGSGKAPFEIAEGGNVTVKLSGENTLTSESNGNAGLQLTNANLVITSADGDGEITGSLEAAGDSTYSAGIGSGYYKDFGSIIINGGTITATGSTFGAGIGGASRGSGSITINGGNVSASSRAGAGIGGGTTNSIITITGGTVDASSNSGAAIGGGQGSEGTVTVNISGGYITVSTNNSEADCIGSGAYSSSTDTVTITGGYFGSGSAADETVYDVTAAAGYSVFNNNDTATNGTYPVYVKAAYTVTQSLTNVTSSNTDTKVIVGGSYSTTLTGINCYVLPDSITVTAGGTELTAGTDYTYNSSTGELSISNVTGNIVITAEAANISHSYNSGEITKAATCTTDGVKTYSCTICGDTYTEVIPATGHSYDEGEVTTAATCIADGVMTYTCTVCGDTYTEVIPATGHTEEIDSRVEPTCTSTGLTEGSHCSVCGEVITAQEVIPATGHSYDSGVITTAASCTTDGVMTYTCTCDTRSLNLTVWHKMTKPSIPLDEANILGSVGNGTVRKRI